MKIHKVDEPVKGIYAIRIELPEFLDNPTVKLIPLPKMTDKWYADIFIEVVPKKKNI